MLLIAVLGLLALAAAAHPAVALTIAPDPGAGWHGRAVARPHAPLAGMAHSDPRRGWRAGQVRRGIGLAERSGSLRVREVQRRLRRLGYRPGRADGRFGPRTESAVRWFQIKHGIPAVGVVDAGTFRHLKERTAPGATAAEPGTRLPEPATAAAQPEEIPFEAATPADAAPAAAEGWPVGLSVAAMVAAALIALTGLVVARRRRKPLIVPVTWPLWAQGRHHRSEARAFEARAWEAGVFEAEAFEAGTFEGSVRAIAVSRQGGPDVVHYLIESPGQERFWASSDELHWCGPPPGDPEPEIEPLAIGFVLVPSNPLTTTESAFLAQVVAAIEAECARRGWRLDQVVRDSRPAPGTYGTQSGFVHALERIADAEAQALVVCELQDLTRSASELATLLDWFADSQATLVALDIGLDTSSPDGALTHQAIASVGAWERERHISPEDSELLDHIVQMRSQGLPMDEIVHELINQPDTTTDGTGRESAEVHHLADARRQRHNTDQGARHGQSA